MTKRPGDTYTFEQTVWFDMTEQMLEGAKKRGIDLSELMVAAEMSVVVDAVEGRVLTVTITRVRHGTASTIPLWKHGI